MNRIPPCRRKRSKMQDRLNFVEDRLDVIRRLDAALARRHPGHLRGASRTLSLFVDSGMPRALALLSRQLDALDQYVGLATPPESGPKP